MKFKPALEIIEQLVNEFGGEEAKEALCTILIECEEPTAPVTVTDKANTRAIHLLELAVDAMSNGNSCPQWSLGKVREALVYLNLKKPILEKVETNG